MSLLAGLLAGLAVLTACGPAARRRLPRSVVADPASQAGSGPGSGSVGRSGGRPEVGPGGRPGGRPVGRPVGRQSTEVSRGVVTRWAAAGLAGLAVALLMGGVTGWLGGAVLVLVLVRWIGGLDPLAERRRRARAAEDLPVVADLLAACLLAGASVDDALAAVARVVGGPLGGELSDSLAVLRLGADPSRVWTQVAGGSLLAPLGRALARAAQTGAPLAAAAARLAEEQRAVRRTRATETARAVGVRAAAPLGLCFLPGFLLLAVVPAVIGLAGTHLR